MLKQSDIIVAGVDEAGRGPWAGPVVSAAVIIPKGVVLAGLDDSKRLSPKKRQLLYDVIQQTCIWAVAASSTQRILQLNIFGATMDSMARAVKSLKVSPGLVMVDGKHAPELPMASQTVVGGDGKIPEIAAASIMAKVTRDKIMQKLSRRYPVYKWDKNSGYGVPAHQEALKIYGVAPHHRESFAPIRKILQKNSSSL